MTAQQYGCVVIQDQALEYVVDAKGIFTVRDLMGMDIGITMIKQMLEGGGADVTRLRRPWWIVFY